MQRMQMNYFIILQSLKDKLWVVLFYQRIRHQTSTRNKYEVLQSQPSVTSSLCNMTNTLFTLLTVMGLIHTVVTMCKVRGFCYAVYKSVSAQAEALIVNSVFLQFLLSMGDRSLLSPPEVCTALRSRGP